MKQASIHNLPLSQVLFSSMSFLSMEIRIPTHSFYEMSKVLTIRNFKECFMSSLY